MVSFSLAVVLQASLATTGPNYNSAYARANASGRPLVVLIGAKWCGPCRHMKHSVIPKVKKSGSFRKVEFAYVDYDHQHTLAQRMMEGGSVPQLVMFWKTRDGWNNDRLVGGKSVAEVEAFIASRVKAQAPVSLTAKEKGGSPTEPSGRSR